MKRQYHHFFVASNKPDKTLIKLFSLNLSRPISSNLSRVLLPLYFFDERIKFWAKAASTAAWQPADRTICCMWTQHGCTRPTIMWQRNNKHLLTAFHIPSIQTHTHNISSLSRWYVSHSLCLCLPRTIYSLSFFIFVLLYFYFSFLTKCVFSLYIQHISHMIAVRVTLFINLFTFLIFFLLLPRHLHHKIISFNLYVWPTSLVHSPLDLYVLLNWFFCCFFTTTGEEVKILI